MLLDVVGSRLDLLKKDRIKIYQWSKVLTQYSHDNLMLFKILFYL